MIKLTAEEREALHLRKGVRKTSFYARVLDKNSIDRGIKLTILDGQLDSNRDYDVVKSGRIQFEDISEVDLLSDKIQVFMVVNDIYEWSLGIYMIMDDDVNTLVLADETVKLQQAKHLYKKVFKAGSLYTDALEWFIVEGINSIKIDIQSSPLTLTADIIVDESLDMIKWFNKIADQINYVHLYVDENGYFKSHKYIEPRFDNVGYSYFEDEYSVITKPITSQIDSYRVPNAFKCIVSRGDIPPLVSVYINNDSSNRFSVQSRGFTISRTETVENIASQQELDLYTSRMALKAQMIEEVKQITTATMPHHQAYDIIELEDGIYEEESYSINLTYDGEMVHYLRRVIHGFEGIGPNS